jgi:hypothetical protein
MQSDEILVSVDMGCGDFVAHFVGLRVESAA